MRQTPILLAAALLCSCNTFSTEVQRSYQEGTGWAVPMVFTTADVRVITERPHPLLQKPVMCTEPTPDVAKALSSAASVTAQGGTTGVNGSLAISAASAEALAELAGRSTALLGLRDGLYRACEAYSNGIIGQDAYAMVLARYGQLMTTLFVGQDIASAVNGATKAGATATSPVVGSQPSTSTGNKTSTPSTSGQSAGTQTPNVIAKILPAAFLIGSTSDPLSTRIMLAANPAPADGGAALAGAGASPSGPPASSTAPTVPPNSSSSVEDAAIAALSLARVNEDYMNEGVLGLLLVACINDADPTRWRPVPQTAVPGSQSAGSMDNSFLKSLCPQLDTVAAIQQVAALDRAAATPLVNPAAILPAASGSQAKPAASAAPTAKTSNATVKAVQQTLKGEGCPGCDPGPIDAIDGELTDNAVRAYQYCVGLPVNGKPTDAQTLSHLGIKTGPNGAATAPPAPAKPIQCTPASA